MSVGQQVGVPPCFMTPCSFTFAKEFHDKVCLARQLWRRNRPKHQRYPPPQRPRRKPLCNRLYERKANKWHNSLQSKRLLPAAKPVLTRSLKQLVPIQLLYDWFRPTALSRC